jgi:hypothetical protein
MTRRGDLRPASPERMIGRRWRKCRDANPRCPHAGRRLPDLRAEDAGEGPRAPCGRGLRFGTVRGRGQAMISASTPGCVASQAPRQLRIWSSACGSVAAPARSTWSVSPLASLLMQPHARKKSRSSPTRAGSLSRIQDLSARVHGHPGRLSRALRSGGGERGHVRACRRVPASWIPARVASDRHAPILSGLDGGGTGSSHEGTGRRALWPILTCFIT